MIKAYFDDLPRTYSLQYFEERQFLGTGGGLSLLRGVVSGSFIVSNCDIIVDVDYSDVLKFHQRNGNVMTFVGALKEWVVPYGVIHIDPDGKMTDITEKPSFSFLTSTGIYVMESSVLKTINDGECIGLPDIAQRCINAGERIGVYPVSESDWMDMGQFSEMESMLSKFKGANNAANIGE
jgi:NDP-sugar pyrophosphorylase family protein